MKTEIEIQEKPLFQIKTAKKKHLEQVRDSYMRERKVDFANLEILGYIDAWNGVLVRDPANGRYSVTNALTYQDWLMQAEGVDGSEAWNRTKTLPQLFLD